VSLWSDSQSARLLVGLSVSWSTQPSFFKLFMVYMLVTDTALAYHPRYSQLFACHFVAHTVHKQ